MGKAKALGWCVAAIILALAGNPARASDHIDSPTVAADPRADIGDLYAWMSGDGHRLNVVMTIVGKSFSDKIDYIVHIDSGRRFGRTTASIDLSCRIAGPDLADCRLGRIDRARGQASVESGISGEHGRVRLFAGMRDDPFFNNVRGTRDAYDAATAALKGGVPYDVSGCPQFDAATSRDILARWSRTDGGPGSNFLKGWSATSIIASIELDAVNKGGAMLAVWATTAGPEGQIDRAARPLTGNALLATIGPADERNALKERYNRATPSDAGEFAAEIAKGVALYDGFDGRCGNGLLADHAAPAAERYLPLARLLADDRLWLDSRSATCSQLFAVERAALNHETALAGDCGGRALDYDAVNVYRSLLVTGATTGVDDGVHKDDRDHSADKFPFLAAP